MINKILIMCPSRGRPERVKETIKSWRETTADYSDFLLAVDRDDEKLDEYKKNTGVKIIVFDKKNKGRFPAELWDKIIEAFPDYKYYSISADDVLYKTKNWDRLMIEKLEKESGWGQVYGNNLRVKHKPNFPVISANLIELVGYFCVPGVIIHTVDSMWWDICEGIGKSFYMPEIITELGYQIDGEEKTSDETTRHDTEIYVKWKKEELPKVIERIKTTLYLLCPRK